MSAAAPMQADILKLIVCPGCGQKLELSVSRQTNGTVSEGWLRCPCGRSYPIVGTIPRMLQDWRRLFPAIQSEGAGPPPPPADSRHDDLKRWTQRQFGFQWTTFHEVSCDFWENFFTSMGPVEPEFFRGKRGLDAGCGFGRHLLQAARCGARVVGIDYSRAIESSFENTQSNPNIALIQADIEHLPFSSGCFDFVYSIGVLHHLPDPLRGFSSLVRHVRPGGAVIVWCYSNQRRWTIRLLAAARLITTRLPLKLLRWISVGTAIFEWAFILSPYRLLPQGPVKRFFAGRWPRLKVYEPYPFQVICADWFDRLAAPVRYYFSGKDLEAWCAKTGLVRARITATGLYGWTLYAEKP
ncbi:MAG: methyltransferase domain-containing protein [Candidatus Omnitrophica bacterium]|nr:methyltransferase domain-containing protein [Candidatus Omnitrophota bacterium]